MARKIGNAEAPRTRRKRGRKNFCALSVSAFQKEPRRDTLLPKLLSGELEVPDIETLTEGVA